MDPTLERRLRDADPNARLASDPDRDQDWLRSTAASVKSRSARSRRPRGLVLGAAAAAVVLAAAAGGAIVANNGGDGSGGGAVVAAPTVTNLKLPAPDAMAMCIRFDVDTLAPMPVAFSGTVREANDESVLLDVDHWYRGGDTDQVRLASPKSDYVALEGGIDFQVGARYLITATDGRVNFCGFSGPWTQEMADTFAQAFGTP
jgi:hypothetical protein